MRESKRYALELVNVIHVLIHRLIRFSICISDRKNVHFPPGRWKSSAIGRAGI